MIAYHDIVQLNFKRARKLNKKGGKKYRWLLLLILIQFYMILNVGYGINEKLKEFFYSDVYPDKRIIAVYPYDYNVQYASDRTFSGAHLNKIVNLNGVQAFQKHFYYSPGHYFIMSRFNYQVPFDLIGYDKPFFDLYVELDAHLRHQNAIPILLSESILQVSYHQDKHFFERRLKHEKQAYLGKLFEIMIQPVNSVDIIKRARKKLTPENMPRINQKVHDKVKGRLQRLIATAPDLERFYRPIKLKFQIVGFVQERTFHINDVNVIPIQHAKIISEMVKLRQAGIKGTQNIQQTNDDDLLYLWVEPYQQLRIIKEIRQLNYFPVNQQLLNENDLPGLVKLLKTERGIRNFVVTLLAIFLLFMMFSVYQLQTVKVIEAGKEIGIFRCLGASKKDIKQIFFHMCLLDVLKITGYTILICNFILILLGFYSARYLNEISPAVLDEFKFIANFGDFTHFWLVAPLDIQMMPLLVLLPVSLLAAYIPIKKASSIDPVVVMKD